MEDQDALAFQEQQATQFSTTFCIDRMHKIQIPVENRSMRLDSQHDLDIAEYVRLSTDPILQQSLRSSKICRYFHSAGSSCRPHQGSRTLAVRCKLQLMELYRIDFKVKLAMEHLLSLFLHFKGYPQSPPSNPPQLQNDSFPNCL